MYARLLRPPRNQSFFRACHGFGRIAAVSAAWLLHGGTRRWHESGVEIVPVDDALRSLDTLIA